MLIFAVKKKRTSSIAPKRHALTVSPMSHSLHLQQAKVRHILRGPTLQPKLTIGQPNDKYEQEADRVADKVMRMPEPGVQRQVEPEEEEEETLQAKQLGGKTPQMGPSQETQIDSLRGGGLPLYRSLRKFFEPRFGYGFSRVRIHTDSQAAEAARASKAQAFTLGRDIVFGSRQFAPGTREGRRLLAHELTHVVQQRMGIQRLQRKKEKSPCAIHAYDQSDPKDTAVIPEEGLLVKWGLAKSSNIGVSSVADMVTKVNAYVNDPENTCSCVSRLEINGHGTDGYQSVGNGDKYINNEKALVHDSKEEHLKQLGSIKFCSSGLFMMLGCHVGRGKGKKLLKRVSNILPGKLIGGAQHYTAGTGLGSKKVTGAGDPASAPMSKRELFLTSKYVRWHIVIGGKEYVINGTETTSTEGKAKLKAADKIKVKTSEGVVKIK